MRRQHMDWEVRSLLVYGCAPESVGAATTCGKLIVGHLTLRHVRRAQMPSHGTRSASAFGSK